MDSTPRNGVGADGARGIPQTGAPIAAEAIEGPTRSLGGRRLDARRLACSGMLALVLCALALAGFCMGLDGDFSMFTGSPLALAAFLVCLVTFTVGSTGVVYWLYGRVDASSVAADRPADTSFSQALRRRFLRYWGFILLAWLPTIAIHLPGTITWDTLWQSTMSDGWATMSAHHPPLDTWLYGLFWSLGDLFGNRQVGLFAHTVFQVLLTAASLSFALCYLRRLGVPRGVRAFAGGAVCLLPIFPLAAECMTKDYLFSAFYVPWLVIFTEALRTRGRVLGRPRVLVAYVMLVAMLALTKKTGVYVCGLSALAAVFYLRRDSPRLVAATLGTILAYLVLVESLLFSALGIRPGASSEMLSIPLQQTARYALTHPDDATEQERAAITAVLGDDFYELVEDEYDPAISDPVKALFDNEAPLSDKLAYLGTWLAQGLRHPGTYLAATFANVYEVFYPASLMEQFNDIPAEWHSEEMLELLGVTADAYVPVEDLASTTDTISSPASLASAREAYWYGFCALTATPANLLMSKAFYASWLPLFVLAYAIYRRSGMAIAALVPTLLSTLVVVAGPVTQARYLTPQMYTLMLVLALCWVGGCDGRRRREAQPAQGARARKSC